MIKVSACSAVVLCFNVSAGGECVWRGGRRRPPGRVDGSVRGLCVEARRGRPFPSQVHRRAAVGDGGAVRTADPRSDRGSRHVQPNAAQPVEGHGGHLHEAQRDPHRQRPQSHTHRVLSVTSRFLPRPTTRLPFF